MNNWEKFAQNQEYKEDLQRRLTSLNMDKYNLKTHLQIIDKNLITNNDELRALSANPSTPLQTLTEKKQIFDIFCQNRLILHQQLGKQLNFITKEIDLVKNAISDLPIKKV